MHATVYNRIHSREVPAQCQPHPQARARNAVPVEVVGRLIGRALRWGDGGARPDRRPRRRIGAWDWGVGVRRTRRSRAAQRWGRRRWGAGKGVCRRHLLRTRGAPPNRVRMPTGSVCASPCPWSAMPPAIRGVRGAGVPVWGAGSHAMGLPPTMGASRDPLDDVAPRGVRKPHDANIPYKRLRWITHPCYRPPVMQAPRRPTSRDTFTSRTQSWVASPSAMGPNLEAPVRTHGVVPRLPSEGTTVPREATAATSTSAVPNDVAARWTAPGDAVGG